MARQAADSGPDHVRTDIRRSFLAGATDRPMIAGIETWLSAVADAQREIMGFVTDRLRKDGEAVQQLMATRSPSEALRIQSEWAHEMWRDYLTEVSKMAALYTRSATGSSARPPVLP